MYVRGKYVFESAEFEDASMLAKRQGGDVLAFKLTVYNQVYSIKLQLYSKVQPLLVSEIKTQQNIQSTVVYDVCIVNILVYISTANTGECTPCFSICLANPDWNAFHWWNVIISRMMAMYLGIIISEVLLLVRIVKPS